MERWLLLRVDLECGFLGLRSDKREGGRYTSKAAMGFTLIAASEWRRAMTLAGACARSSTFICHGESWGCCEWQP